MPIPQDDHPTADELRAKLFEDRMIPGAWRVEKMEADGAIEVALFSGPNAFRRALRYADWQYSDFDQIWLEPY